MGVVLGAFWEPLGAGGSAWGPLGLIWVPFFGSLGFLWGPVAPPVSICHLCWLPLADFGLSMLDFASHFFESERKVKQ